LINSDDVIVENGKCYRKTWKLFDDLKENEKVMTLNSESGKREWQIPKAYLNYDNNKINEDMYKILLDDGSEMVVSEKHKVYADSLINLSSNSLGDNTLSGIIFFNVLSPEKIGEFNLSERARYGASLICWCNISSACGKNSLNSDEGMKDIFSINNCFISSNSSLENFVSSINSCSCFSNSDNRNSGAINSNLLTRSFIKNTLNGTPLDNKAETKTLTSTITFIVYNNALYLLANDSLISLDISSAFSSVNLDFDKIFLILSNPANLSLTSFPTSIETSTLESILISLTNSSGNLITSSSINNSNKENYINLAKDADKFALMPVTDVYKDINLGKDVYFLNENNEEVKVESIEKVPYIGKIYDVDVENDIVLVRRHNSSAIWSGNSNNGTCSGINQRDLDLLLQEDMGGR